MKIRQAFVSNSSSSSFVIIANKHDVDKILEGYTANEQEVIKYLAFTHDFNDKPIYIFQGSTGNLDSFEYAEFKMKFNDENGPESPWDIWYDFKEKLEKLKNVVTLRSQS